MGWLWDSKNKIELSHRKALMGFIQKTVLAKSQSELNTLYNNLKADETAKEYENFLNYTKKGIARQTEWAL